MTWLSAWFPLSNRTVDPCLSLWLCQAKAEWAREKRQLMSANAQEIQEINTLHREHVRVCAVAISVL
jgi:hypothetical protein